MTQKKKDTSSDDVYRSLVERAAKEKKSRRRVLNEANIPYMNVTHWLKGRKDNNKKWYLPPLNDEVREKLLAYLRKLYPVEMQEIEHDAPMRLLFAKSSKIATLVVLLTKLDLNSRCVFCKPLPHLVVRPRPLHGAGITMVVFWP